MPLIFRNQGGAPSITYAEIMAIINPEFRTNFNSPYENIGTGTGTTSVANPGQLSAISPTPTGNGGLSLNSGDYDQDGSSGYLLEVSGWNIAGDLVPNTGTMMILVRPEAGPNAQQYLISVNDGFDSNNIGFGVQDVTEGLFLFFEEDGGNVGEAMFWNVSVEGPGNGGIDLYNGEWHCLIICKHREGLAGERVDAYMDAWIDGRYVNGGLGQALSQNPEYPTDYWFDFPSWSASGIDIGRRPGSPVQHYSGDYDEWWYAPGYIMTDEVAVQIQNALGLPVHESVQTAENSFLRIIDTSSPHKWNFTEASGTIFDSGTAISDVDLGSITGTVTYQVNGPFPGRVAIQISGGRLLDTNSGAFGNGWNTGIVFGWFYLDNLSTNQILFATGNSGGAHTFNIRVRSDGRMQLSMSVNTFSNRTTYILEDLVSVQEWHFCAFRQKADGTQAEAFFDGNWYTVADTEWNLVEEEGTGTPDDWIGTLASRGRVAFGGTASTSLALPLDDGRLWAWAASPDPLGDEFMQRIWDEGVAYIDNGV